MPAAVLDGFRMQAIENFRYEKPSINVTQDAIVDRVESSNTLSRLICVRGQVQCTIENMLTAPFYIELGSVDAIGVATMQLGTYNGVQ